VSETAQSDRLQPALLDRLTDDAPTVHIEAREQRVLTKKQLRAAVLRDLEWLMNASRLQLGDNLLNFPAVENSVLNYGLPSFAGQTASTLDIRDLENSIHRAIVHFEPRILPETLSVKALADDDMVGWHNVVNFQISAAVWAQPVPLELLLRTEVDLESGRIALSEFSG